MNIVKYSSTLILLLLLSGCPQSLVVSKRAEPNRLGKGVVYSLPKQLVKVSYKMEDSGKSLTLRPEASIPDTENTFYAEVNHQAMFSDALDISVKNGLLAGATGYSEDKTGEIVVSLVGSLFSLLPPISFPLVRPQTFLPPIPPQEDCGCKEEDISFEQVIDPGGKTDLQSLNKRLEAGCIKLAVDTNRINESETALANLFINATSTGVDGLIYRHPGSLTFHVQRIVTIKDDGECKDNYQKIQSISMHLAQAGQIGILPLPKGFLSKNEYDFSFSDGMLSRSKIVQPSEVLGAVNIIPNALKAMISVPAELLQLKVNYSTREKELLELKKAALDAQAEIIKKQAELEKIKDTEENK